MITTLTFNSENDEDRHDLPVYQSAIGMSIALHGIRERVLFSEFKHRELTDEQEELLSEIQRIVQEETEELVWLLSRS